MIRKILLLASAVAAGLLAGCKDQQMGSVEPKALPVRIVTAKLTEAPQWISLIGRTQGVNDVDVVAQVSGRLVGQSYEDGAAVKAGDTLFIIDPAPYEAKWNEARAERLKAQNALRQAQREADRERDLWRAKATSAKAYEDAESELAMAKNALESARALERSAAIELDRTRVTAPSGGVAERAALKTGGYVTAGQTVLTRIAQTAELEVLFSPSAAQLDGSDMTTSNLVEVYDSLGRPVKARLDYVSPSVDATNATRLMRAVVPGDEALLPGDLVRVRLAVRNALPGFRIPQKAVVQLPDGTYRVYVVENGHAKAKAVEVGDWDGTDWIVRKGLAENDRVIVDQMFKLRDGLAVRVEPAAAASATR